MLRLAVGICLVFFSITVKADSDAMSLLERMVTATKQLNYDGVFTYQTGNKVQAIRIIHKANENGEVERLLSLDGAAREMIRTDDIVTCIFPEGKKVNVNRRPFGRGFPSDLLRKLKSATPYYNVALGKEGRVANRIAQQLVVTPVDNDRYGYHLWVDKESALLLQSDLLTEKGKVLEKFSFSSVNLDIAIPDEALAPEMTGHQMTWNRVETVDPKLIEDKGSAWTIGWLPTGYGLVAQQHRRKMSNKHLVEQRVYSDGMSSVSVFIEPGRIKHGHFKGHSKMGAVNAYGAVVGDYFVTVVGQAPQHTVEKIGHSIHFAGQ